MLKRFSVNLAIVSLVVDVLLTLAALRAAAALRETLPYGPDLGNMLLVPDHIYLAAAFIWALVFVTLSVYDPRRTLRAVDEFQQVIAALVISALCLAGVVFVTFQSMSRYLFFYFFTVDTALLLGWRILYRILRRVGHGRLLTPHNVLIVGAGEIGQSTAETIAENAWMGFHLIGFLDDNPLKQRSEIGGLPVLGSTAAAEAVVREHNVDEVIVALPLSAYEKVVGLSVELQRYPVHLRVVPDYFSIALFRATVEDFGGLPLINLRAPALNDYQRVVKRVFDLLLGTLALIAAAPLMAIMAVLIRLDSPGPAIFRHQRAGENSKLFWMYKFRTMIDGADARLDEVIRHGADGHIEFKRPDDPRVTRLGRFLRRTSLDELPQLFNVLKGEMSLVGPRPELPWLVEHYEPWQRKRFAVPQGITGWWQVNGRSNKQMHLSTEDDLYYIQNYSLMLDVVILWKTIAVVLKRQGAF